MARSGKNRVLAAAAIVLALAAAAAPVFLFWPSHGKIIVDEGSWTMPGGGPAHISYLPFAPRGPLRERWNTRLESMPSAPPAVAGDRLYVSCENGFLYCLELDSGRPRWRFDAAAGIASMPAVCEEGVFLGTLDGRVLCVDADGELKWEVTVGGAVKSTPIPDGGRVYLGSSDGFVYCLDAADGSMLWSFEAEGPVEVSPCIYEGQLFGASFEGDLFALDARDGRLTWTYRCGEIPASFPCAEGGRVFLPGEFELHCADAQSGKSLWKYAIGPNVISNLAVRGNRLMALRGGAAGEESGMVSLDTRTGDLLWEADSGAVAGSTWLYATNGDVYLCATGAIRAVAAESGIPSMQKQLDGILPHTLTVTEGCLLAGSDSRKVYCFEE